MDDSLERKKKQWERYDLDAFRQVKSRLSLGDSFFDRESAVKSTDPGLRG